MAFIIQEDGSWRGERKISQSSGLFGEKMDLKGESLTDLRALLLDSSCGLGKLAGPTTLEIKGYVQSGKLFDLILPSHPATGYLWEVVSWDRTVLSLPGQSRAYQISPQIGGMAAQVISLRGVRSSVTTLRLLYRRPWETTVTADYSYSIDSGLMPLAELAQALNLELPNISRGDSIGVQDFPPADRLAPSEIASTQTLPSSFNWCNLGKCTAVRDQGNCGSCWAFATVGVFESKLLIAENNNQNLSEQYLVSCNTRDWGCDGGWFAHDYHIDEIPPSESEAGAVLENAFPYQAKDLSCNGPYSHPYRALSWSYVNPSVYIPSVSEIKQAIYNYGPVAAAVCSSVAFDYYSGGVFSTDESAYCGSSLVNHGIVLVGWDDTQGVWILRNSWGPYWGENGYMRIKYGISNVGLGANYLEYDSSTVPPTSIPTTPPPTPMPTIPPTSSPEPYPAPTTSPTPSPEPYPAPTPSRLINYLPLIIKLVFP
ncbi:MAG: hypothetical protein Kow0088_16240 [Anaerolineales bacterium]